MNRNALILGMPPGKFDMRDVELVHDIAVERYKHFGNNPLFTKKTIHVIDSMYRAIYGTSGELEFTAGHKLLDDIHKKIVQYSKLGIVFDFSTGWRTHPVTYEQIPVPTHFKVEIEEYIKHKKFLDESGFKGLNPSTLNIFNRDIYRIAKAKYKESLEK